MLTILIPTINRYEFLNRLLSYYALKSNIMNSNDFKIFVLDSSDPNNFAKNKENISKNFSKKIDVSHFDCFGMSVNKALVFAKLKIDTKYSVICPDDDIILIEAMVRGLQFLETHPDYVAVGGKKFNSYLGNSDIYGSFERVDLISHGELKNDTSYERLEAFCQDPLTVASSVMSTKTFNLVFKTFPCDGNRYYYDEQSCSMHLAIAGKIKCLNEIYMCRQVHAGIIYPDGPPSSKFIREDFLEAFDFLVQSLGDHLFENSDLSVGESYRKICALLLNGYQNELKREVEYYSFKSFLNRVKKKWASKMPGISLIRRIKKIVFRETKIYQANDFKAIFEAHNLNGYEDFISLFKFITQSNNHKGLKNIGEVENCKF